MIEEFIITSEEGQKRFKSNFNYLFNNWVTMTGGSQGKLAKLIGVTQSRISYWLHGMAMPSFVNLYNLSKVFNCYLKDFYSEVDE